MGHVDDICSRLDEKKVADKALIEQVSAILLYGMMYPINKPAARKGCRLIYLKRTVYPPVAACMTSITRTVSLIIIESLVH